MNIQTELVYSAQSTYILGKFLGFGLDTERWWGLLAAVTHPMAPCCDPQHTQVQSLPAGATPVVIEV